MWEWHALGHIPISESHNPVPPSDLPLGLRPHQLRRPGHARATCCSPRATPGRSMTSTCTPVRSTGAWAASHSSFKGPAPRALLLAARRRVPARRGDLGVRQRLDPAEGEAVARAAARAQPRHPHGQRLVKVFTNPCRTLLASSQGNTLSLPGGNWLMGYGGLPDFTEYDAAGHVHPRRAPRQERPGLPDLPLALERPAEERPRGHWPRPRRVGRAGRLGELERRHRSRLLARAGGLHPRARSRRSRRPPRRAFRRRSRRYERPLRAGAGAGQRRAPCSAPRPSSRAERPPRGPRGRCQERGRWRRVALVGARLACGAAALRGGQFADRLFGANLAPCGAPSRRPSRAVEK